MCESYNIGIFFFFLMLKSLCVGVLVVVFVFLEISFGVILFIICQVEVEEFYFNIICMSEDG